MHIPATYLLYLAPTYIKSTQAHLITPGPGTGCLATASQPGLLPPAFLNWLILPCLALAEEMIIKLRGPILFPLPPGERR